MPKSKTLAKQTNQIFLERLQIKKFYLALVKGIPEQPKGRINYPIEFSETRQKAIVTNFTNEDSKLSNTKYEILGYRIRDPEA